MRNKKNSLWLPDVSSLAVVGFVIMPFFMLLSSPRHLGDFKDMHVRLPDAVAYETCVLMDEPVYIIYLDKKQRLYLLSTDKNHPKHLRLISSFRVFQHTIDSLLTHSDNLSRPKFVIKADKDTKMPVIQRIFDCFLANGIQKFTLLVDANSAKREEYWKFLEERQRKKKYLQKSKNPA